jgi:hypothetical protein
MCQHPKYHFHHVDCIFFSVMSLFHLISLVNSSVLVFAVSLQAFPFIVNMSLTNIFMMLPSWTVCNPFVTATLQNTVTKLLFISVCMCCNVGFWTQ